MNSILDGLLMLSLLSTFFGCGAPEALTEAQRDAAAAPGITVQQGATADGQTDGEEITPYQYLNLFCGNAEELSFSYRVTDSQTNQTKTGMFQKKGDDSVASFTTKDMNENSVSVRELERNGKVYYIMDDSKLVKTYLAPAADFLLYEMMTAAETAPARISKEGAYSLYEYRLPFVQDESVKVKYCFFMQGGALKKMTVATGDAPATTYEFSEFKQELLDSTAFVYPQDYRTENYDYIYSGDFMPPWWEIGNDA